MSQGQQYKMASSPNVMSTPVNTVTRDSLAVLIANNIMNESVEFTSDYEVMETDSPMRKSQNNLQPISKKLFHSPHPDKSPILSCPRTKAERAKKARKRKQILIPDSNEQIKRAYVEEYERDGYSPECKAGMRKRVLISLFHNKEYCMDVSM